MKHIKKLIFTILTAVTLTIQSHAASSIILQDTSFDLYINNSLVQPYSVFAARWGTYSDGVFTSLPNGIGYVEIDEDFVDLMPYYSRIDNTHLAAGSLLYIAIYQASDSVPYSSSFNRVILSDPNWIMPVLNLTPDMVDFGSFGPNTQAVFGQFTYSATGNDFVNMIPEPSTSSLLLAGMLVTLSMRRKFYENNKQN